MATRHDAMAVRPLIGLTLPRRRPTVVAVAGLVGLVVAVLAGVVLWLAIDRRCGRAAQWRPALAQAAAFVERVRAGMQLGRLTFEISAPALPSEAARDVIEMPLLPPSEVSMLIKRSGSADDLASELRAAAARFSERGSFDPSFFDPRRMYEPFEDCGRNEFVFASAVETASEPETQRTPIHLHLGPSTDGL